ncbi:MAG: DUF697 domain-containing protein [Planctomycetes bacterium]|nr:DUF697 domain-containing protein [Planctomycetota bacterium]
MWEKLWKQASRVITIAAVVLAFLLAIELIRAYQTLRDLHPWAGYAFLAVLAGLMVYLVGRLLGGWRYRPRALKAPAIGDLDSAGIRPLRRYGAYLARYLRRLGVNESLDESRRAAARAAAGQLCRDLASCKSPDELRQLLRKCETGQIEPLLAELDVLADSEIGQCVRDVMIGVAASPWPLVDALIVLYRNGSMITRITHIYNSRPPLREQLAVLRETIRLVATIKLAHMMRKMLERAVRDLPLAGRIAEALTQAVGAGVLTSAAGHAAKGRCRAFRGWNRRQAAEDLRARLGDFIADCWKVASESLLGPLGTLYHRSVNGVAAAFRKAVETTAAAADTFVRKPVTAGTKSVADGWQRWRMRLLRRQRPAN